MPGLCQRAAPLKAGVSRLLRCWDARSSIFQAALESLGYGLNLVHMVALGIQNANYVALRPLMFACVSVICPGQLKDEYGGSSKHSTWSVRLVLPH